MALLQQYFSAKLNLFQDGFCRQQVMRYNRRVLVSDVASHSQDPTICAAPELHKQGLDVTRLEARSETFILTGEALGNSSLMNFDSIFDHMHLILLTSSDRSPSVPRTIEVDGPFSTAENSLDVTLVMTPEEIIPSKRFFRQNDPVWNALLSPAGLCCKKTTSSARRCTRPAAPAWKIRLLLPPQTPPGAQESLPTSQQVNKLTLVSIASMFAELGLTCFLLPHPEPWRHRHDFTFVAELPGASGRLLKAFE
jgi:hypothetical protein